MLTEKHDLIHELPEHREKIHELKMNNNHFARLFEEYLAGAPDSVYALNSLALLLEKQGQRQKAAERWREPKGLRHRPMRLRLKMIDTVYS